MNRIDTVKYPVLLDKCEGNEQLVDGWPMNFCPWSYTQVLLQVGMYGDRFLTYLRTFDKHWTHLSVNEHS